MHQKGVGIYATTGFHTIRYLFNLFFIVGECGQVLQDTILAGDELDALEKHYKENILKMEKCHIKFLGKDPRFKYSTSCIVCGKSFMKSFSLLCHITDKIKSKKNDWKAHDDFLEGMITSFWGKKLILTLRLTTPLLKTGIFMPLSIVISSIKFYPYQSIVSHLFSAQ